MLFHKHKRAILSGRAFGHFTAPDDPMVMSAEGEGGGDAGGGSGDAGGGGTSGGSGGSGEGGSGQQPDTFSQADLDRIVGNERRSLNQKIATLQASADKVAGLEATIKEQSDAKELADASTAEQATILAQRAADQHKSQIDELGGKITTLEAAGVKAATELTAFKTRTALSQELAKAGMLPVTAKHAIPAMVSESEVTLTDDGDIATIKLNGVMQTDAAAAVSQFLTDYPHFKAAPPGGGGTSMPTPGAGLLPDKPLHEQPDNALWDAAKAKK